MDVHNGPSVYNPKSLPEFLYDVSHNPDVQFLAGGTDLMRKTGFYPNPEQKDIINLESVPDFSKVIHSERFVDVGPMVTLEQLLATGSFFLSDSLYQAIDRIGTTVVRNKATVGGALCSQNGRSSLACYLAAVGAQAEVRIIQKKVKKYSNSSAKWIPISKLYEPDGSLIFSSDAFISKIRIPASDPHTIQIFKTVGSVYRNPSAAVSFAFVYSMNQRRIASPQLFISFPSGGFYYSTALNEEISGTVLPVNSNSREKLVDMMEKDLKEICPMASELQIEQSKRLFETVLIQANTNYLAG